MFVAFEKMKKILHDQMKFLGDYFEPENSSTKPPDIFLNISLVGIFHSPAFFCLAWKYKAIFSE